MWYNWMQKHWSIQEKWLSFTQLSPVPRPGRDSCISSIRDDSEVPNKKRREKDQRWSLCELWIRIFAMDNIYMYENQPALPTRNNSLGKVDTALGFSLCMCLCVLMCAYKFQLHTCTHKHTHILSQKKASTRQKTSSIHFESVLCFLFIVSSVLVCVWPI